MGFKALELSGKVALVTGSTKGIGHGIARGLAEAGADLVITSRHQQDCDQIAAEISETFGVKALAFAADVSNLSQVKKLMDETKKAFGKLDILVNNAGVAITKKAEELSEEEWDFVTGIDLKAVFFVAQAAGKLMMVQKQGKIINIASMMGLIGDKQILPYCVSKGGVIQMTKVLALEWAKHNIQVNALCPGYIITPMNEEELQKPNVRDHLLRRTPMHRFGTVEEMQGPAVFLASDASSFMTGQTLTVDGGWTAQ